MSSDSEPKRIRFIVRGQVQGVGFRYFTLNAAKSLGLDGFVSNRLDGTVLCEAQGSTSALEQLRQELERGPGWSSVAAVTAEEASPLAPDNEGFQIR